MARLAWLVIAVTVATGCSGSSEESCDGLYMNPQEPGPVSLQAGGMWQLSTIRAARDFSSEGSGECTYVFDDASHFIWTSSSSQVASVDATGLVRALAAGTATISANGTNFPYQFAKPAQQQFIITGQ